MKKLNSLSIETQSKLAIISATLIWGISFCFMKSSVDEIPPNLILAIRFSGAAIMLCLAFFKHLKKINIHYIWQGAVLGFCLYGAYILQTIGLIDTTPGKNAFLTATYCIMVPFIYWIISKKKPDTYNFVSAFLCIIGIGFISITKELAVQKGDLFTIAGGFMFAMHMIFVSIFAKDKDAVLLTVFQFFFGSLFSWAGYFTTEAPPQTLSASAIWQIAYLAFVATGLALLLQNIGQKNLKPQTASILLSLESVFGVLFSIILGYETIKLQIGIGFLIVFVAIIISETKLSFIKRKRV